MEPDFKSGDVIIVDPEIKPHPGEFIVAANHEREATFKKYRPTRIDANNNEHFKLVPLNNDYPIISSENTPLMIIGTMIGHRIYRRKR
ncbi:S24 family peptidase [Proteus sp. G2669]|nr:S24 family peptidase [Proteus sp. G2669]